jgi:hypothetical protein
MRRSHDSLAVALALALALACGPRHDPAPSHDVPTAAAFCAAVMSGEAELIGRCFDATPEYVAAMKALPFVDCAELVPFVAAGRIAYDPQRGATCAAFFSGQSCAEAVWDGEGGGLDCARVFRGTVAPGSACAVWDECADGYCDTTAACQGTCVAYRAAGETCAPTDLCAPGLACDSDGTGTCVAPSYPGLGEPCGRFWPGCAPGLFCDGGTCAAQVASGSCLAGDLVCAAGTTCVRDSYLNPTRAECVPFATVGEACGAWTGVCSFGAWCDASSGTCAAAPPLGGSCGGAVTCLPGAFCDTAAGACRAALGPGATCTRRDQCASGLACDLAGSGTCAPTACLP